MKRRNGHTLAYIIAVEDIANSPLLASQVYNILEILSLRDPALHVDLVCLYPIHNLLRNATRVRDLQRELARRKISLHVLPVVFLTRHFYIPWWLLSFYTVQATLWALWIALRVRPDLVHCRSYPAGIVGTIVKAIRPTKVVFDTRALYPEEGAVRVLKGKSVMFDRLSYRIWKRLEKAMITRADAVTSVSEACSEILAAQYPRSAGKLKTIPTVTRVPPFEVLTGWRTEVREALQIAEDEIVVTYVGTWFLSDIALPLFERMTQALPGARWYFVLMIATRTEGDPAQYRASLEARVTATLGPGVRCTVRSLPHEAVARHLAAGDIAVQTAAPPAGDRDPEFQALVARTALSVKLTEYLACGLPVLVSQYHGAAAQVVSRNGLGLVYEQASDEALATWLKSISQMPDSERERIWHFALEHYDLRTVAGQYEATYRDIAA